MKHYLSKRLKEYFLLSFLSIFIFLDTQKSFAFEMNDLNSINVNGVEVTNFVNQPTQENFMAIPLKIRIEMMATAYLSTYGEEDPSSQEPGRSMYKIYFSNAESLEGDAKRLFYGKLLNSLLLEKSNFKPSDNTNESYGLIPKIGNKVFTRQIDLLTFVIEENKKLQPKVISEILCHRIIKFDDLIKDANDLTVRADYTKVDILKQADILDNVVTIQEHGLAQIPHTCISSKNGPIDTANVISRFKNLHALTLKAVDATITNPKSGSVVLGAKQNSPSRNNCTNADITSDISNIYTGFKINKQKPETQTYLGQIESCNYHFKLVRKGDEIFALDFNDPDSKPTKSKKEPELTLVSNGPALVSLLKKARPEPPPPGIYYVKPKRAATTTPAPTPQPAAGTSK